MKSDGRCSKEIVNPLLGYFVDITMYFLIGFHLKMPLYSLTMEYQKPHTLSARNPKRKEQRDPLTTKSLRKTIREPRTMSIIAVSRQELVEANLEYLINSQTEYTKKSAVHNGSYVIASEMYYWHSTEKEATLCLLAGIGKILAPK